MTIGARGGGYRRRGTPRQVLLIWPPVPGCYRVTHFLRFAPALGAGTVLVFECNVTVQTAIPRGLRRGQFEQTEYFRNDFHCVLSLTFMVYHDKSSHGISVERHRTSVHLRRQCDDASNVKTQHFDHQRDPDEDPSRRFGRERDAGQPGAVRYSPSVVSGKHGDEVTVEYRHDATEQNSFPREGRSVNDGSASSSPRGAYRSRRTHSRRG